MTAKNKVQSIKITDKASIAKKDAILNQMADTVIANGSSQAIIVSKTTGSIIPVYYVEES